MNTLECPNKHDPLTIFKKPIAILYLLPEDVLDLARLEGTETPENMFGHIVAACEECGFIYTTSPAYDFDYETGNWQRREEEAEE